MEQFRPLVRLGTCGKQIIDGGLTPTIHFTWEYSPLSGWATAIDRMQAPLFLNFAKPAVAGVAASLRNILTSDNTIRAALISATFVTTATHGIDQGTVQRMLAAKSSGQSAKATKLSAIVGVIQIRVGVTPATSLP